MIGRLIEVNKMLDAYLVHFQELNSVEDTTNSTAPSGIDCPGSNGQKICSA